MLKVCYRNNSDDHGTERQYVFPLLRGNPTILLIIICSYKTLKCRGDRVAQRVRSLDLTTHTNLSPIRRGFAPGFVNDKKGCTRLTATSDKVYQLLAHPWLVVLSGYSCSLNH